MLWIDELSRLSPTFDFGASLDRSGSPSLSSRQGHATIRSPEPLRGSLCVRKRTLRLPLEIRSVSYLGLRCKLAVLARSGRLQGAECARGSGHWCRCDGLGDRQPIPQRDPRCRPLCRAPPVRISAGIRYGDAGPADRKKSLWAITSLKLHRPSPLWCSRRVGTRLPSGHRIWRGRAGPDCRLTGNWRTWPTTLQRIAADPATHAHR